jgi:hypothetical protein
VHGGYLDRQVESVISIAELKGKLADLEERRLGAERELEKLTHHEERMAELERDAVALMAALPQSGSRGPRPVHARGQARDLQDARDKAHSPPGRLNPADRQSVCGHS